MDQSSESNSLKRIEICGNGPYMVMGNIPLVRKTQVVSDYGEPLSWKNDAEVATDECYLLCRCGQSGCKPFCDGTHAGIQFNGADSGLSNIQAAQWEILPSSTNITIRKNVPLCTSAGFCANRVTDITEMARHTEDSRVRSLAIAMIELCPSGSLTYSIEDGKEIEVDLPQQIAVTREVVLEGVIQGPLWVTGGITIVLSDGQQLERRNRVTLCNCGRSHNKPFCDGTHRVQPVIIEPLSSK